MRIGTRDFHRAIETRSILCQKLRHSPEL